MQNLNRKNSFEDFGAEPSPMVWEKIEKRLPETRGKKRRWIVWSSIAAVLTGAILLSTYLLDVQVTLKQHGVAGNSPGIKKNETTTTTGNQKSGGSDAGKNQSQVTEKTGQDNNASVNTSSPANPGAIASSQTGDPKREKENKIVIAEPGKRKVEQKMRLEKPAEENKSIYAINTESTATSATKIFTDERGDIEKVPHRSISMLPLYPGDTPLMPATTEMMMVKKKSSVSRWQVMLSGGENYSYRVLDFASSSGNTNTMSTGEKDYLSENEKGIQTFAFETGVGYSLSTHFNLNFGINYFTAGQERNQSEIVFSSGIVGSPNTQYSVNTSAGVVFTNGQQFDETLLNSTDSSLFAANYTITGNPTPEDSSTVRPFTLRQEFSFISFPLLVQYQTAEHRFTPYIGLGFSAGYILRERVTVNNTELDYDYMQNANSIVFFAEAQAGVKYRINRQLFFKLQPSFRYGLNSLSGNESIEWIPYSAGLGAGINFRF